MINVYIPPGHGSDDSLENQYMRDKATRYIEWKAGGGPHKKDWLKVRNTELENEFLRYFGFRTREEADRYFFK